MTKKLKNMEAPEIRLRILRENWTKLRILRVRENEALRLARPDVLKMYDELLNDSAVGIQPAPKPKKLTPKKEK